MTNHPLTDEDCYKLCNACRKVNLGLAHVFDSMRRAADRQLEQDQKKLEDFLENFVCRGHNAEANDELRVFVNSFKSYMRPTQEDNS